VKAPGVVVVQNVWRSWPELFLQHRPRRKHERQMEMAEWQRQILEERPAAFLRGLFR
jgi:hypothetical protein